MAGRQEPLGVNRMIVVAWATAIVVTLIATGWVSAWIVHARPNGPPALPTSPAGRPPAFGVLDQNPYGTRGVGDEIDARSRALLHGYGWVDDAHTHARIPIERAKALLLAAGGVDGGH